MWLLNGPYVFSDIPKEALPLQVHLGLTMYSCLDPE